MQIEVLIGPQGSGTDLIAEAIRSNARRLRKRGVFDAASRIPVLLRRHDWIARRVEGRLPGGDPGERAGAAQNRAAMAAAEEDGAQTLLILSPRLLGPDAASGLFPLADRILPRALAGLPEGHTRIHLLTSPIEDWLRDVWQAQVAALATPLEFQDWVRARALPDAPFSDLARRLRAACPGLDVVLRDGAASAPDALREGVLRDIGIDPRGLRLPAPAPHAALDRGQADAAIALAGGVRDGRQDPAEARTALAQVLAAPSGDPRPPRLAPATRGKLSRMTARDAAALAPLAAPDPLKVFFMVEPGPLELQAHLLVASLQVHGRDRMEITGFCRDDRLAALHPETTAFLTGAGVALRPLVNDFSDGYPAGNKLIAAREIGQGPAVFLDTDMMLRRPARFLDELVPGRVSVAIDTVNGWSRKAEDWQALHDAAGTGPAPRDVTLLDGEVGPPIYNAGLVLFPRNDRGAPFGEVWHDTARRIEEAGTVPATRPWLDTIALAAALSGGEGSTPVRPLSPQWNCTTRNATEETVIVHYHGLRQLLIHKMTGEADAILAASSSPFSTLAEAARHHDRVMKVGGDVMRRAMRHGVSTAGKAR